MIPGNRLYATVAHVGRLSSILRLVITCLLAGCSLHSTIGTRDAEVVSERWILYRMDSLSVGWGHERMELEPGEPPHVETTLTSEMRVKRLGMEVVMRTEQRFVETLDGRPLSFFHRSRMSSRDIVYRGTIAGGRLELVTVSAGREERTVRDWDSRALFPCAAQDIVRSLPLDGKDEVSVVQYLPGLNDFQKSRVRFLGNEETDLLSGREVLGKYVSTVAGIPMFETIEWRNGSGEVMKSEMPFMNLTAYRTDSEKVVELMNTGTIDLIGQFLIRPDTEIPEPRNLAELLVRIEIPGATVSGTSLEIPQDRRQEVTGREGDSVLLKLRRIPLTGEGVSSLPPDDGLSRYLRSTAVIQSDHPRIVEAARDITEDASSPLQCARELNSWVHENITTKDYSVGFASAVEVLETRTGDCTEHSVLLVALARALGYPARVVVGMVSDGSVFAFHMWAEVGIDGWVPFDPALGEEEIDVTHIKLADSPVDAGWMRDVINPIFYLFSQMRIDVVNQTF